MEVAIYPDYGDCCLLINIFQFISVDVSSLVHIAEPEANVWQTHTHYF